MNVPIERKKRRFGGDGDSSALPREPPTIDATEPDVWKLAQQLSDYLSYHIATTTPTDVCNRSTTRPHPDAAIMAIATQERTGTAVTTLTNAAATTRFSTHPSIIVTRFAEFPRVPDSEFQAFLRAYEMYNLNQGLKDPGVLIISFISDEKEKRHSHSSNELGIISIRGVETTVEVVTTTLPQFYEKYAHYQNFALANDYGDLQEFTLDLTRANGLKIYFVHDFLHCNKNVGIAISSIDPSDHQLFHKIADRFAFGAIQSIDGIAIRSKSEIEEIKELALSQRRSPTAQFCVSFLLRDLPPERSRTIWPHTLTIQVQAEQPTKTPQANIGRAVLNHLHDASIGPLTYDRPGFEIPLANGEYVFKEMFEDMVREEFSFRGFEPEEAMSLMWKEHVKRYGPSCKNCFWHLGMLAQCIESPIGKPSNSFLSCFVPRFFPLLAQEYKDASGSDIAYYLCRMWAKHKIACSESVKGFQLPCSVRTCQCIEHWNFLFNRGDCKQMFSDSIRNDVQGINSFRSKFFLLVEAEYQTTQFPDATNFALGRMWQKHLCKYEELCTELCQCWMELAGLAEDVLAEMIKRQDEAWMNRYGLSSDSTPTGALLCYSRHALELFAKNTKFPRTIKDAVDECFNSWPALKGEKCGEGCKCRIPSIDADFCDDALEEFADPEETILPDSNHYCFITFDCSRPMGAYFVTESKPSRPVCKIISGES